MKAPLVGGDYAELSPEMVLRERYARDEITLEEFEARDGAVPRQERPDVLGSNADSVMLAVMKRRRRRKQGMSDSRTDWSNRQLAIADGEPSRTSTAACSRACTPTSPRCCATDRRPRRSPRRRSSAPTASGAVQAGRGSADAWLFGIARNAALDELRRLKRRAALETEPEDVAAEHRRGAAERALRRETVRAALATLEPAERDLRRAEVLRRAVQRGDRRASSARARSNAGTRLHRVIQKLRKACDA